jgi:shikimate dehydrogenase
MSRGGETISGATKVFAVIGDPVGHSLSPLIHNGWIKDAGLDAVYVALQVSSLDAASDIRVLARAGLSGLNVTLPHKIAALQAASSSDPACKAIGAANTLVRDGAGWRAHNTDVSGFEALLAETGATDLKGKRVVIVGAGGAARAAAYSLAKSGARLTIANRSLDNAQSLASELAPGAATAGLDQLAALAAQADLVINSASLGHAGEGLPPLPEGRGRAFIDLSYGKAAAPILAAASRAGWIPHDGLPMLVAQAAEAFRLWFGVSPDSLAALTRCREAVKLRA